MILITEKMSYREVITAFATLDFLRNIFGNTIEIERIRIRLTEKLDAILSQVPPVT